MKPHLLLLIACLAPSAAYAGVAKVEAKMPIGGGVQAPAGYVELCQRRPSECDNIVPVGSADTSLDASRERWARIFGSRADWAIGAPASITVSYARPEVFNQGAALSEVQTAPQAESDSTEEAQRAEPAPPEQLAPAIAAADISPAADLATEAASAREPSEVDAIADLDVRQLRKINSKVNRSIRRASDRDTFGREDYWATPEDGAPAGDCEDYVLAKRRALTDAGVSKHALSIALVRTPQGEMHAVLLVATARGEVVLDNLSPWVLSWREAPYTWLARQAPGIASEWVRVAQIG